VRVFDPSYRAAGVSLIFLVLCGGLFSQISPPSPPASIEAIESPQHSSSLDRKRSTGPIVVHAPKIDPRLRSSESGTLHVFVVLKDHPQREILQRLKLANSLRLQVAEGRYAKIVERAALTGEDMSEAHKEIDEIYEAIGRHAVSAIKSQTWPALEHMEATLAGLGATKSRRYIFETMLYSEIPSSALEHLERNPDVEAVVLAAQQGSLQINNSVVGIGAPTFWNAGYRGSGQTVAILDSGVKTNHPAFGGRVTALETVQFNSLGCLFGDNPSSPMDYLGHGTHVGGIVTSGGTSSFPLYLGVAPALSRLVSVKIACRTVALFSQISEQDLLTGLDVILSYQLAKVVNLSAQVGMFREDSLVAKRFDAAVDLLGAVITVAAGNSGPSASTLGDPGMAYNIISVANASSFQSIAANSSRGPSVGGRRKPDLNALGTKIYSANANWDGALGFDLDNPPFELFKESSGTSMAAPHVAGAAALLRQRGVTDPKAIKAILLNTTGTPGWNAAGGWGHMNLDRAYRQSTNYVLGTVTPRAGNNPFRLYRGTASSIPFSATLVWNRFVTGSAWTLSDLDLKLYSRSSGSLIDSSISVIDNVEQVVGSQAGGVVAKVEAVDTLFGLGLPSEPYALAFSDSGFTSALGPQLSLSCTGPTNTTPGVTASITCTASNSGDLEAFGVVGDLNYIGQTGGATVNFGTILPGASVNKSWNLIGPSSGTYTLVGRISSISYGEQYVASANWNFTSGSTGGGGGPVSPGGLRFVSVPPCRLMETRAEYNFEGRTGSFGPPFLRAGESRTLTLASSNVCQIPTTARAYVLNVTLIPRGSVDFATLWPGGETRPNFWTIRSPDGQIVANQAIVKSGNGAIQLYVSHDADFLIDITGYFADAVPTGVNLVYYPLTPCRVIETRLAYRAPAGPFGPPTMAKGETRRFRFPNTPYCSVPPGATAYSATLTVVPPQPLPFMTLWPAGSSQPNVSSINSFAGRILANNVIVPASQDGSIDVYSFDRTDFIVDINGYFAPDNGQGLYYYPVVQCRANDSTVSGGIYQDNTTRTINIPAANCSGIPAAARGYVVNVTAIPGGSPMPFITVYPTGQPQPNASILNAFEGQTVTNSTIVPAGTNGAINVYAFKRTNVVVEVSGYFGR
jgi:subtilisin family serine protease